MLLASNSNALTRACARVSCPTTTASNGLSLTFALACVDEWSAAWDEQVEAGNFPASLKP